MISTKQLMFLKLNNYACKISITKLFLLYFIFSKTVVNSQIIFPANNDSLNFTEFYFEISPIQDAQEYEIVYWEEGKENEKTSLLSKNISIPVKGLKKNCNYYWQYSDLNRTKVIGPFKFFILPYKFYNLEKLNIKIFDSLPANFNDYIIIDALGAVINRNGEIIWHIPERPFYGNHRLEIRDIRISNAGTVSLLKSNRGYEYDIRLREIWNTEQLKMAVAYHHDFTIDKLGNRLLLYVENSVHKTNENWNIEKHSKNTNIYRNDNGQLNLVLDYNGVVFSDRNNKILKEWKDKSYFKLNDFKTNLVANSNEINSLHSNSFCFDESNNDLYINYKNIHKFLKINLKTGAVYDFFPNVKRSSPGFFSEQHSISIFKHNKILLLNNNSFNPKPNGNNIPTQAPKFSSIQIININNSIPKLELEIPLPGIAGSMGNVEAINDSIFLVGMGTTNKTLIISKDKKIKWLLELEIFDEEKKEFKSLQGYRVHLTKTLFPNYFHAVFQLKEQNLFLTIFNGNKSETDFFVLNRKNLEEEWKTIDTFKIEGESQKSILINNRLNKGEEYKVISKENFAKEVFFICDQF